MSAHWIRLPGEPDDADTFTFFRRRFRIDAAVEARLRVTADGRYVVWVNGVQLGRGPVRSLPQNVGFDEYEVPLRASGNVVAILARHYGRPTLYWVPGGNGGVLAQVDATGRAVVATDATWRARRAPYRPQNPPQADGAPDDEVIDGRAWPFGWLEADFDDEGWESAVEIAQARDELPVRAIELPAERSLEAGEVHLHPGETSMLDFGEITNAHVRLSVRAPAGTTIEVRCGDEVAGDQVLLDVRDWSLRYTAAGRDGEEVEAFEPVGFRYVGVRADAPAQVSVHARERTYPRAPGARFACSDPTLEAIWNAGARTLDLCSVDAFIDCPGREQRAWLGDDYVHTLVSFVTNPDVALVRHDLRLHAAGIRADGLLPMVAAGDFGMRAHTIPDFSLLWVLTLARVWDHTADRALIEELMPVAARILDAFEAVRAPDGLLAGFKPGLEGWIFIDWAQTERGEHIAAMDALYAMALDEAARVRDAIGGDATVLLERADATRDAFELYWDERRSAYVDAASHAGARGTRLSQQTNSVAILGCAPPERWARILDRVTDGSRLVRTLTPGDGGTLGERLNRQWEHPPDFDDEENVVLSQPFFAHFLHQAFVRAGREDLVLPSIARWSQMVARNGLVEEYWTALPGMGSRCHAWSATPTYDLTAHVLGVRPGAAGWRQAIVDPQLGNLEWAEGSVPTPHGFVRVRARRDRAPEIELPRGVELYEGIGTSTNRGR